MPTDLLLTDRTRETRDRLLRVSRQVFEEDGFDGASISRIVEGANVSRGTFYLYFESKEDIFRTLAEETLTQVVELQRPPDNKDPVATIRTSIAGFIASLQRHGTIPATVDPRYAATALTGMVDRFAYVWLVLEEDFDEDEVVEHLTRLWYQAIGGTFT